MTRNTELLQVWLREVLQHQTEGGTMVLENGDEADVRLERDGVAVYDESETLVAKVLLVSV